METIGNRALVLKTLQESRGPMSLRDVMAASGLRRGVVNGALYRLRDKGCVEVVLTPAGFSQFKATGKQDDSKSRVLSQPRRKPRKKSDLRGVELLVRVLDSNGQLIELTMEQALEVERQLKTLRSFIGPQA